MTGSMSSASSRAQPPSPLARAGLLLAAAAAITFTVGNHALGLAAWVGPLLLLAYVRRGSRGTALLGGAAALVAAQMIGWSGVLPFAGVTYYAVTGAVGLVFFVPYAVDRVVAPLLGHWGRLLLFPLSWVLVEHLFIQAGQGSWGAIAYAHLDNLALLQVASVAGLSGITFLNGLVASAIVNAWDSGWRKADMRIVLCTAAAVVLVLVAGSLRLASAPAGATVRAAGIVVDNMEVFRNSWAPLSYGRPLTPAAAEKARPLARRLQEDLLRSTRREARAGARLVAWSEGNALVFSGDEAGFVAEGKKVAREERIYLFMAMAVMTPGERLAENKLVVIDPAGRVRANYLKSHPTPGEASVAGDGRLGWIDTPFGRVAWAICYDYDYPALIAQAGRAGADILINPAWDDPGMTPLHARMATLRSIDNGAAQLRPTNGGLSLAVDGRGVALAQVASRGTHTIVASLPVKRLSVPYPRLGDWLPALALCLLLLFGLRAGLGVRGRPAGTGA